MEKLQFKRADTVPLYFYLYAEKLITAVSKSSGTVTITTLQPHGVTTSNTVDVRMYDPNASFDVKGATVASYPTTRTLTYALGSDTVSAIGLRGILTVPVVLTSNTCYFTVKINKDDADASALITKSWTSHTDATAGITSLELTTTESNIAVGTYFYELKRKDANSKVYSCQTGILEVVQDILITES